MARVATGLAAPKHSVERIDELCRDLRYCASNPAH